MIRRNLFIVARGNSSAYVSHDPATGNTRQKAVMDQEIQTPEGKAYIASMGMFNEVLVSIATSPAMNAGSSTTIYVLQDTAVRYYEARKVIRECAVDVKSITDEEVAAAQEKFILTIQNRLEKQGFEALTDEQVELFNQLVYYAAATTSLVSVKKLNDIRFMKGITGKNMKKLESMAWDLVPPPEVSVVDATAGDVVPF